MPGEKNKTLTARCSSCGKEGPAVEMLGLVGGDRQRRKTHPVCKPCFEKGWRPPGYTGF